MRLMVVGGYRIGLLLRNLAAVGMALAGFALSCLMFYPGFMSFDSSLAFWLARHGEGFGMTPQIMVLIWRALLQIAPSDGGALFVLNNACYWLALMIFSLSIFCGWYARMLFLLICGVLSPCTLILAHLWSDGMLIGFLSLACALLWLFTQTRSMILGVLAALLLLIAGLTRFNALPALVPLYLLWGWVFFSRCADGERSRKKYVVFIAALIFFSATLGLNKALEKYFITIPMSAWAVVALWDLAAISISVNEMQVPAFARPESTTIANLSESFWPSSNVPIFSRLYDNGNPRPYTKEQLRDINEALILSIVRYPVAYIEHRWRLTKLLFGRYRDERSLTFWPAVTPYQDNPPIVLNDSGIQRWAIGMYQRVVRGWWYAPVTYIVLSLLLLPVLWPYRREPVASFALVLVASGLLYAAPLPLVAPAAELRYASWFFFTTLLSAAIALSLCAKNRCFPQRSMATTR